MYLIVLQWCPLPMTLSNTDINIVSSSLSKSNRAHQKQVEQMKAKVNSKKENPPMKH
jgi:hypothetical protein